MQKFTFSIQIKHMTFIIGCTLTPSGLINVQRDLFFSKFLTTYISNFTFLLPITCYDIILFVFYVQLKICTNESTLQLVRNMPFICNMPNLVDHNCLLMALQYDKLCVFLFSYQTNLQKKQKNYIFLYFQSLNLVMFIKALLSVSIQPAYYTVKTKCSCSAAEYAYRNA